MEVLLGIVSILILIFITFYFLYIKLNIDYPSLFGSEDSQKSNTINKKRYAILLASFVIPLALFRISPEAVLFELPLYLILIIYAIFIWATFYFTRIRKDENL